MTLKDKIAFIPGGSSGIGLAIAQQLFSAGVNVMIFSRDEQRLTSALAEIEKFRRYDTTRLDYQQLDVAEIEKVRSVIPEAMETLGVPDILINCAGRSYPRYFQEISYEQFDETMKINLYGIWNVVSVLFPKMKEKGGHIINVSSVAGIIGVFGFTDYSASKFAIIGFSEALRSESKQYGIKVSVLCPADTETPAFEVENRTKPPETAAVSGAGDLFQPEQIARAVMQSLGKNTFLIIPGFMPKVTYYLKRFVPGIVEWVTDSIVRKVQKNLKK